MITDSDDGVDDHGISKSRRLEEMCAMRYVMQDSFAGDRRHGNALTAQLLEKFWRYRRKDA